MKKQNYNMGDYMRKYIFIDILLNSKGEITKKTENAIVKEQEEGY